MKSEKYIILLKQARGSLFVFDDIVQLGYKIIYVDTENLREGLVSVYLKYNLSQELDSFFEEYGNQLKSFNVVGVVAFSEHLKIIEMKIAEYLGVLKSSKETYFFGRDKYLMKDKIIAAKIPYVNFKFFQQDENNISAPMPFPFIVKPNLGYASGGVYLVNNDVNFI